MRFGIVLGLLLVLLAVRPAVAIEPVLIRESVGADANVGAPCTLEGNTDGTAANYRWYNLCSGYIWIIGFGVAGDAVGTLYGGPEQPEVRGGNSVKRAITYFRNVIPNYGYEVNIFLDADFEGDGCFDSTMASDIRMDPALRWNCSAFEEFDLRIPCDLNYVIVRTQFFAGAPYTATDAFTQDCDPNSTLRSFFYGIEDKSCIPLSEIWGGVTGNLLNWLVLDTGEPCPPNASESRSWGAIKGLFR